MGTLIAVTLILYFLFLVLLRLGWEKSLRTKPLDGKLHRISVVIPFRNEEGNLAPLIGSLSRLEYPLDNFEVIMVNDHSTDESMAKATDLISNLNHFKIVELAETENGKKAALSKGIDIASGQLIATTDADCIVRPGWLGEINKTFHEPAKQLVFGAVAVQNSDSLFSKLQVMEFTSLIGSAAATTGLGWFTMCNGANMAFRRRAFQEVDGYKGNEHIPSGDDEFLARKILSAYPRSVSFLAGDRSVVTTAAQRSLRAFVSQRVRWAGKWKFGQTWSTKLLAFSVAWVQLAWLLTISFAPFHALSTGLLIGLISTKLGMEALVLVPVHRFMKVRWSNVAFIVLQFVYPIYVLAIGLASVGRGYQWKGRSLGHKM